MTLPEIVGTVVGAALAAAGAYRAVTARLDAVIGKKDAPSDGSLRDLVMRIDGKIDAQNAQTSDRFRFIDERLGRVEARVFTPPKAPAVRVVSPQGGE